MSHYRKFAIQTYLNQGEPSARRVRAKPLPQQGLDVNMRVECSVKMRENHPVGSIFLIDAIVKTNPNSGVTYLSAYHGWPYELVTLEQAHRHIAQHFTAHASAEEPYNE